jgi:hypothetical protein
MSLAVGLARIFKFWNLQSPFGNFLNITGNKTMSTYLNSAKQFFEACETGKGWEACSAFCHPGASFSSQTTVHTMAEVQRGITISTRETLSTLTDF